MSFLESRKAQPDLQMFLQHCLLKPECRSLDLGSFLLKPVQRICKYPLLLKALLKVTPESHADFGPLTRAYDKAKEVVEMVNEQRREVEVKLKVNAVMKKLEFSKV